MYNSQKKNSKVRNHPEPNYTKLELYDWLKAEGYTELFSYWERADYAKGLRPSVDRLDSTLPYTFSNMRLTIWDMNNKAAY